MKRRIVSLLTAVLVACTIFAVPIAETVTAATTETTITEETSTDDEADVKDETSEKEEQTGDEETTEPTDPSEPADPVEPEEPTLPDEPALPEEPTTPDEPSTPVEPEKPSVPSEPEKPAVKPVSLKGAKVTIAQTAYEFTKKQRKPVVTVKLKGKKLVKGKDYKVTYSNNIYPGTAKITIKGINGYKGTLTKKFEIATVKKLVWKKSTPTTVTLAWNARKNVSGYKVYGYSFTKKKWVVVKTVKSNTTTIKNLKPGSGYQYKIVSYYKKGNKTYNAPASAIIKVPTKPEKVTIKKLVNHPALYAQVKWNKKNGSGYQVKYSRYSSYKDAKTVKVASEKVLAKTIKNLKDNKQYYVKVRAYRTYGNKTTYGSWSKSKAFSTDGTRWYTKDGKKYYYKKGEKVKGNMMFGKHQYFFNYEDGAWSGASPKMWRKVKNSSSNTKYLIAVSRELNRVCVYEGKKGNWKLKYYWMCSTGRPENGKVSKTPTGSWLMPKEDNHLGYIGGHIDYTCWYATRFYNRCFFHSVIYQPASKTSIQDGRLGMNISDGCIRMNIDNAKWIYDNCHTGTRVIVY